MKRAPVRADEGFAAVDRGEVEPPTYRFSADTSDLRDHASGLRQIAQLRARSHDFGAHSGTDRAATLLSLGKAYRLDRFWSSQADPTRQV